MVTKEECGVGWKDCELGEESHHSTTVFVVGCLVQYGWSLTCFAVRIGPLARNVPWEEINMDLAPRYTHGEGEGDDEE